MAASVVASIALPISNNFSFAPSMDAYGKLSEYGKLGAWSPLSLFAASEVGAWYDPSDLSTMFQDSAGTTPVTADGQPVGLIRDKSGNNNHASQATAAKRPLYKTSGGLHWLQFDGVDDSLSTAAIDFSSTNKMSIYHGLHKLTNSGDQMFLELGPGSGNGSFYNLGPASGGQNYQFSLVGSVDSANSIFTATTFNAPISNVISIMYDTAGALRADEIKPRINGVIPTLTGGGATSSGSGPFAAEYALYIGARNQASLFFNGRIYSMIVLGRLATTQEITDTETWVAAKTGVTLP